MSSDNEPSSLCSSKESNRGWASKSGSGASLRNAQPRLVTREYVKQHSAPLPESSAKKSALKSLLRRNTDSSRKIPSDISPTKANKVKFVSRRGHDSQPVIPQRRGSVDPVQLLLLVDDDEISVDTAPTALITSCGPIYRDESRTTGQRKNVPSTVQIIDSAITISHEAGKKLKPALKSSVESRWC